jgi:hypothetical protein
MIIHKDVKLLCCFKKIYSNFLDFFFLHNVFFFVVVVYWTKKKTSHQ